MQIWNPVIGVIAIDLRSGIHFEPQRQPHTPTWAALPTSGSANVQSTSFTTDGTGLISRPRGASAGLIGNNGASSGGGFSGLATVSGGAVVPYSYSGNQVIGTAGTGLGGCHHHALTTGL